MADESNTELSPESPDLQMCQLCQLPVQSAARTAHKRGLHHQAAQQIAAAALDRWRAHMAANDAIQESLSEPLDTENVIFCAICTEAVPSTAYTRHVTAKPHLISALDEQVFEELVKAYIDEEDLKLLEALDKEDSIDDGSAAAERDAKTTYNCSICALKVPSAFKSEHERSVHHRTRVALAAAAARRTSAFLHHQPPSGVPGKRNIKMTELLKSYTGIDLMKKNTEDVIEKEVEVEEKASQSEVKKRLTAKQYFTDILPYLQYTKALYTLIIDDTEYVTIKNLNGTCMRVHVANFNGIYSTSSDVHYEMKCRMCHGYNQYVSFSSELDHDKLHVMSLGHIRHVLTPIDNVHGLRKIDNGQSLCVLCNTVLLDHNIENHVFNDIHHTANLAEALRLGKKFKESKEDLKIIIYSAPRVDNSNFMRHPVRNYDSVLHLNSVPQNGSFPFGGNKPQGRNMAQQHMQGLFGSGNSQTGFGASFASTQSANTGATFGAQPAGAGLFSVGAGTQALDTSSGTGFSNPSNAGPSFGTPSAGGGVFGASNAGTTTFGVGSAGSGFNGSPASTFGTAPANPDENVPDKNGSTDGTTNSATFGGPPKSGTIFGGGGNNIFGAQPEATSGGTGDSEHVFSMPSFNV